MSRARPQPALQLFLNHLCLTDRDLVDALPLDFEHEFVVHLHDHASGLGVERLRLAPVKREQHALHGGLHQVGRAALAQRVANFATRSCT